MLPRLSVAVAVVLVVVGATVTAWRLGAGGTARDAGVRLDLVEDGPFQLRLGGALWRDRTIRDEDQVPDVAYVTRDEPLTVEVTGRDGRRPGAVDVHVDGRVVAHHRVCGPGACPSRARVTVTPRVRSRGSGRHRVTVVGRGARGGVVRTTFEVTVGHRLPPVRSGEPVTRPAASAAPSSVSAADRRRTLAIIDRERRSGTLRAVLGSVPHSVVQLGRLDRGRRHVGTTTLLALTPPRRRVRARVPAYLPSAGSAFRIAPTTLSAPLLRDVLVDVDLATGRVVTVEPGPRSRTDRWPTGALLESPDAARRDPALIRMSEGGPAFLAYDGSPDVARSGRDWPVSLVFAGRASVGKVKTALRRVGFTRRGHTQYLAYRVGSASPRFDGDRGLKTACDAQGTDTHVRLYAPAATDRFRDPELGDIVVATAHLDRADGCGTPPTLFGFSERAEARIASVVARRLHWRVRPGFLALGNAEPYRRDMADNAHIWWSDGHATLILVP